MTNDMANTCKSANDPQAGGSLSAMRTAEHSANGLNPAPEKSGDFSDTAAVEAELDRLVNAINAIPDRDRPRRDRSRGIVGEYKSVGRMTREPDLMRKANMTPMTDTQARVLIGALAKLRGIDGVAVRFVHRASRGRATSLPHGGYRITLSSIPLPPDRKDRPYGLLRVGLVLHEFAHVVMFADPATRREAHGPAFVAALDRLLVETKALYAGAETVTYHGA